MTSPSPQPALRTSELLALGVSPDELRGPRWRSPYRGVHAPALPEPPSPTQRIADALELVPTGGAVAGWAAGHLLGVSDLDGRGRSGRESQDIVIVVPTATHPTPRPGIRYRRWALCADDLVEVAGVCVTTAVRTAFDLARSSSVEDGLVATDMLCRQLALDPAVVRDYLEAHPRKRGVPVARSVLALADPRSRSSGESRLRYIWVVEAGLPRPQCNPYVLDAEGLVVAMPDLLDVESGLAGEYDGSGHRDLLEHTEDNAREESLEALGLTVVRATSVDVGSRRARTVRRILDGRDRAASATRSWGWRPSPLSGRPTTEW
jgi:hypothetical protein